MQRRPLFRRIGPLAAAGLALAILPAAALAERPGGPPSRGGRGGMPSFDRVLDRHAERLGLDDATRARIRAIADARRDEGERLAERVRALHGEMHALLDQDAPDTDAVMRQAEAIGAAETEMHKQRLATLLEIRALLTPEQRRELVRIFEERKSERGRGGRGPGPPETP
jgi:Spy/CpxP family protein refolding chaperone